MCKTQSRKHRKENSSTCWFFTLCLCVCVCVELSLRKRKWKLHAAILLSCSWSPAAAALPPALHRSLLLLCSASVWLIYFVSALFCRCCDLPGAFVLQSQSSGAAHLTNLCKQHALLLHFWLLRLVRLLVGSSSSRGRFKQLPVIAAVNESTCNETLFLWASLYNSAYNLLMQLSSSHVIVAMTIMKVYLECSSKADLPVVLTVSLIGKFSVF